MGTVLHSWLDQAQENSRYDSVAAKYGLVVDTPSGMSQTGQNALRFLRSLSEHSPTFFEDQARLLSPPTPDLLLDLPVSPHSATLGTPISMAPARRPGPRTPTFDDALFSLDLPLADDPVFVPNVHHHHHHRQHQRARPYPALPRIHPHPDLAPLGGTCFSPPLDPLPSLNSWDKQPYPPSQNYPSPSMAFSSPQTPDAGFTPVHAQQPRPFPVAEPELEPEPEPSELEMHQMGGDADRARMSALMYASMRARTVVAANEADSQGW